MGEGTTMRPRFTSLAAVGAAGLGDRFRSCRGRSGRRYVFARLDDHHDSADLDGAVVVRGHPDGRGGVAVDRVVALPGDGALDPRAEAPLFVHWPAAGSRTAVVGDLFG